ncbi:ATP synthase F1 subunit delta [Deltaproteobacteria bacterium]|nr:ATP synthase F1 subunit delta [Deltaproteobacteria bacterium]
MSNSRLSKRYARALFSLGQEDGSFNQYGQELEGFINFCQENAEFGHAISNPIFPIEDRNRVLQTVLKQSGFSDLVKNFLNLLLDKNRIGAIDAITEHYARLTDEASNITHAEIITAKPLKDKTLDKVVKALEGLTSKQIEPDVRESPDLIGGIVVKIGDLVLDGSVKAQFEGLKESFKRGE